MIDYWLVRLPPRSRLWSFLWLQAAFWFVSLTTIYGMIVLGLMLLLALLGTGYSWHGLSQAIRWCLFLLAPYWLLWPWIEPRTVPWLGRLPASLTPLNVLLPLSIKTMAVMILIRSVLPHFPLRDVLVGIQSSRLPFMLKELLLHLVHQLGWLRQEVVALYDAWRLRGIGNIRHLVFLAKHLPLVWLPRLMRRAEERSEILVVRQWQQWPLLEDRPNTRSEGAVWTWLCGLCLLVALWTRWMSWPV